MIDNFIESIHIILIDSTS